MTATAGLIFTSRSMAAAFCTTTTVMEPSPILPKRQGWRRRGGLRARFGLIMTMTYGWIFLSAASSILTSLGINSAATRRPENATTVFRRLTSRHGAGYSTTMETGPLLTSLPNLELEKPWERPG